MKKTTACLAFTAATFLLSCENEEQIAASEVPPLVMSAFQGKYPNITAEEWVKENEDNKTVYEAKFKNNGKDTEAEFDENGNFLKEE